MLLVISMSMSMSMSMSVVIAPFVEEQDMYGCACIELTDGCFVMATFRSVLAHKQHWHTCLSSILYSVLKSEGGQHKFRCLAQLQALLSNVEKRCSRARLSITACAEGATVSASPSR